jgi:hypothetical protein
MIALPDCGPRDGAVVVLGLDLKRGEHGFDSPQRFTAGRSVATLQGLQMGDRNLTELRHPFTTEARGPSACLEIGHGRGYPTDVDSMFR